MDPYASAKARLAKLVDEYEESSLNEATTRLRYIDTLLKDCLNWPTSAIRAEGYYGGDYVDYELGEPAPELIVEAKREGIYFALPAGVQGHTHISLQTAMEDPATSAAVNQVLGYCQSRGVPVAAICNGHQLLAFYASRQDGVPPLKGRALVFSSLREMHENFQALWNNLSRDGMAARNLQRVLHGNSIKILPPQKLADSIANYPGFRARTPRETDLKLLGGILIQDLENEEQISDQFLRECYCRSGALSQYAMVSREILKSRYDAVAAAADVVVEPVRGKRGVSPKLSSDMVAAAMSRRPIIVLGDVGVGKSMFIRHLVKVDAAESLKSALVFYINFGDEPALETNLEAYVYRRITTQLQDQYGVDVNEASLVKSVYNAEINAFDRGIDGELAVEDPPEYRARLREMLREKIASQATHLKRVFEHFKSTARRNSVLLLDNVDQRPPSFQESVFLIAQSLAAKWPATVFVALRPTTFFESKSSGSLAAYQLRVFTVQPTRVDEVVAKRLGFAKAQLVNAEGSLWPDTVSLSRDDLSAYLDVLIRGFGRKRDDLNELLDNISGGNLRLALTYLATFVGSGYISTDRILEVARSGDVYEIPIHEFLRAIIYGEYDYFDPRASEICNLFDCTTDDGREHFLLPLILAQVQRLGEAAGKDGFVPAAEIHAFTQGMGFTQEQTGPHITRGHRKKLLESAPGKGASGPYRITSIGSYMYRSMVTKFSYIDAMTVDTPITNIAYRRLILDVRPILERLNRGDSFIDYLNSEWASMNVQDAPFDWTAVSVVLRDEVARARVKAERSQARRRAE